MTQTAARNDPDIKNKAALQSVMDFARLWDIYTEVAALYPGTDPGEAGSETTRRKLYIKSSSNCQISDIFNQMLRDFV
jgi:hypothetical protein